MESRAGGGRETVKILIIEDNAEDCVLLTGIIGQIPNQTYTLKPDLHSEVC